MTLGQMHSSLSTRLEDIGNSVFSNADKNNAIGSAQRTIASILDVAYLKELETKSTNIATSPSSVSGMVEVDLHSEGIIPFGNKLTLIQVPSLSVKSHKGICKLVGLEFIDQERNSYISSDQEEMMAIHFGKKLYLSSGNITLKPDRCHITYILDPDSITDYTDESSSVPLLSSLHRLVLDIAEAELWHKDKKPERSSSAYIKAHTTLKTLNDRLADDYREVV